MNKKLKAIFLTIFATFVCLTAVNNVKAVPNPNSISWEAAPATFVTSLYTGVLDRGPENGRVVADHAARISTSPVSRWNMFWAFVNSPEYQSSRWARQNKEHSVYRKYNLRTRKYYYTVSKGPLAAEWRVNYGPTTFGIAVALRRYYQAFERE
jgi:hypothetical protein